MTKPATSPVWLFAYGSLIWRPDFDRLAEMPARAVGWSRRFWQGSHDHRGTAEAPGRVVTLVRDLASHCDGVAYQLDPQVLAATFSVLDHREKNGYERVEIELELADGKALQAITYLAAPDNFAWLGPAPVEDIARQIATSHGPSGSNLEYLVGLGDALRGRGWSDSHVFAIEREIAATAGRPHSSS